MFDNVILYSQFLRSKKIILINLKDKIKGNGVCLISSILSLKLETYLAQQIFIN